MHRQWGACRIRRGDESPHDGPRAPVTWSFGAPASQPWLGEEPRSQTGRQVGLRAWVAVVRASPTQSRRLAVVPASSGGQRPCRGATQQGERREEQNDASPQRSPSSATGLPPPSPRDSCTRLPTSPRNRVPGSRGVPRPQLLAWAAPPEGAPAVTARCVPISESPSPRRKAARPPGERLRCSGKEQRPRVANRPVRPGPHLNVRQSK